MRSREIRRERQEGCALGGRLAEVDRDGNHLPTQEDLNSNEAIHSYSPSSFNTTATILQQDFSVFTTESQQSRWPPSNSPSQPAPSAQPNNDFLAPQQDFVLFDQPSQPQRQNVNRSVSSPASQAAAFGSLNANTSHFSHTPSDSTSPTLQNQRVAQIIRATGHQTTSSPTAFTNRFNSPAQFYAHTIAALQNSPNSNQQNRSARPPVPLFTQGVNQQTNKMDFQDALRFEDMFQGGASTAFSSPYDAPIGSVSSSVSNIGTVSPQQLFLDGNTTSAPNSTALTNMTSPSLCGDSPDLFASCNVSPEFGEIELQDQNWASLFEESTSTFTAPPPADDLSPAQQSEELDVAETASKSRRKSGNSPSSGTAGKHSSVSGVNSRRRDKPLPPIVVDDPSDSVAMKRARNTLAARKSRERKAMRFEELEAQITKLQEERDYWRNKYEEAAQLG
ncbi:uncharacterized protein F4822DRAFT_430002 [Hypoxylon trugodes]|uniref:uncharacterized protein n=1 Tax=Hypoxylon trugodes TaxID=326681 RepID=UPI002195E0F2|nr:uncharacterized protein F4822DRAFT_430002 [Hypoxylon trugodes]KAI1387249.1 hypothetical protein F4822DRAFT_430002 [Hypoxylon trugodes]